MSKALAVATAASSGIGLALAALCAEQDSISSWPPIGRRETIRPAARRGAVNPRRTPMHEGGDSMVKKTGRRAKAKRSRPAAKRDLVRRSKASAYAKRTAEGRFKDMDDVGRSQKADKPRKANKTVRSGYGDQGDAPLRGKRRARR